MTDTQKQPASVPAELVKQWLDEWGNSDCLSVLQFIANRACDYGREQAQWVPVSERPPARHFRALVTATNEDGAVWVTSAHYNRTGGWLGMRGYLLAATH